MRKIALATILAICPWAASAQGETEPTYALSLTKPQLEYQARLNSVACKSIGLDDGGTVCESAKLLNGLIQAALAKPPEPKKP